jgi:hypothetical protein
VSFRYYCLEVPLVLFISSKYLLKIILKIIMQKSVESPAIHNYSANCTSGLCLHPVNQCESGCQVRSIRRGDAQNHDTSGVRRLIKFIQFIYCNIVLKTQSCNVVLKTQSCNIVLKTQSCNIVCSKLKAIISMDEMSFEFKINLGKQLSKDFDYASEWAVLRLFGLCLPYFLI